MTKPINNLDDERDIDPEDFMLALEVKICDLTVSESKDVTRKAMRQVRCKMARADAAGDRAMKKQWQNLFYNLKYLNSSR